MIIAQISDSHIITQDHSDEEINNRINSLRNCVADINNLATIPNAVIHTGDLTHNGKKEEYQIAFDILNLLKMPFYITPGNKDGSESLIKYFPNDLVISPYGKFVIYAVDIHKVRLVSVDTLSTNSNKGHFTEEKLNVLDKILSYKILQPTVLFMHHPPFSVPTSIGTFFEYESEESIIKFNEVIFKHPQLVGIFCGHIHRNFKTKIRALKAVTIPSMAIKLRYEIYPENKKTQTMYYLHHFSNKFDFHTEECWIKV